jgi:hypothetical protein
MKIIVINSEIFPTEGREKNYFASTREIISKKGKTPCKIVFHNKKTANPKELKNEMSQKPDCVVFDRCGKATIKKISSSMCSKTNGKTLVLSIGSEHDVPGVEKIKSLSEITNLLISERQEK